MNRMRVLMLIIGFCLLSIYECGNEAFTVEKMHSLMRVGEYDVNRNGDVVYTVREWHNDTNTYSLKLLKNGENDPIVLVSNVNVNSFNPVFLSDGSHIAYLNSSCETCPQIFVLDIEDKSSKQLSHLAVPINSFKYSEAGNFFILALDVYPDCDTLACTADRDKVAQTQGWMHFKKLYVRHWDTWEDGKLSHLFYYDVFNAPDKEPFDMLKAIPKVQSPVRPFGGAEQFDISPDGKELAFTGESNTFSNVAWTTGWKTYITKINATTEPVIISETNARTQNPKYSPDGKTIAYLSMDRPGFEADRLHIILYDRTSKTNRNLTSHIDISFDNVVWDHTSNYLFADADKEGNHPIFSVNVKNGNLNVLVATQTNNNVKIAKDTIFFLRNSLKSPNEVWSIKFNGKNSSDLKQISNENKQLLESVEFIEPEVLSFNGSLKDPVQIWFLKPRGFDEKKKWPLVHLIHGGPQGAWGDDWSFRWNPQLWAAHGYAVAMVNFHGSTGYGQNFTDAIRFNWGGHPFWDIMNSTEHLLKTYSWINPSRIGACGASYGGYMINWLLGNAENKFYALVVHDGVFDTKLSFYSTDELWLPEWEFGGKPWENPEYYDRWNPSNYINNWGTPTLVIHGGKDYRLDIAHGLGTFTALQRNYVKSKFLYFPEENHWVLNPNNGIKWYHTVLDWLDSN